MGRAASQGPRAPHGRTGLGARCLSPDVDEKSWSVCCAHLGTKPGEASREAETPPTEMNVQPRGLPGRAKAALSAGHLRGGAQRPAPGVRVPGASTRG